MDVREYNGVIVRREKCGHTQRRQPCEEGSSDWSYTAISQGTPVATGSE